MVCPADDFDNNQPDDGGHFRDYRKGAKVGEYTLVDRVGEGSFAYVWKASGPAGELVAIKIPFKPADADVTVTELLALTRMSRIKHDHLLETKKFWNEGGRLFIVMELADGSLRSRLKQIQSANQTESAQPTVGIPVDELLSYFRGTALALDFLRERGIRHRDVKPANILIVGGQAKLADFGLAKKVESERSIDETFGGTPAYMAPEMMEEGVHEHSDQYCFAVAYVELRQGRLPFRGIKRDNPDLRGLSLPEKDVLGRALAEDPRDRFPSCKEFVNRLAEAVKATAEVARPAPQPYVLAPQVAIVAAPSAPALEPLHEQPPTDSDRTGPEPADDVTAVPDGTDRKRSKPEPPSPESRVTAAVDFIPEPQAAPVPELPLVLDSPGTEHGSMVFRRRQRPADAAPAASPDASQTRTPEPKPPEVRSPQATIRQKRSADWRRDKTEKPQSSTPTFRDIKGEPTAKRVWLRIALLIVAIGTLGLGGVWTLNSRNRTPPDESSRRGEDKVTTPTSVVERPVAKPNEANVERHTDHDQAAAQLRELKAKLDAHNAAGDLTLAQFQRYQQELTSIRDKPSSSADEIAAIQDILEQAALKAAQTRVDLQLARAVYDRSGPRRAEAEGLVRDAVPRQAANLLRNGKMEDAVALLIENGRVLDPKAGPASIADQVFSSEAARLWTERNYAGLKRHLVSWKAVRKKHDNLTRKELDGYEQMVRVAELDPATSLVSLQEAYHGLKLPAGYSQYQGSLNALFTQRAAAALKRLGDRIASLPRTGDFKEKFRPEDAQEACRTLKLAREMSLHLKDASLALPVDREIDLALAAGQTNDKDLVRAVVPGLIARPKEVGSAMYPLLLTLATAQDEPLDRLRTFGHVLGVDPKDLGKVKETEMLANVFEPGIKLGEEIAKNPAPEEARRILARLFVAKGARQTAEPSQAVDAYENACKYDPKPEYLERLKGSIAKLAALARDEAVRAFSNDPDRAEKLARQCRDYWRRLAPYNLRFATQENENAVSRFMAAAKQLGDSEVYALVCGLLPAEKERSTFDLPVLIKKMNHVLPSPERLREYLKQEGPTEAKKCIELAPGKDKESDGYWLLLKWMTLCQAAEVISSWVEIQGGEKNEATAPAREAWKRERWQLTRIFAQAATLPGIGQTRESDAYFRLGREYYLLWQRDNENTKKEAIEALRKCRAEKNTAAYKKMMDELEASTESNMGALGSQWRSFLSCAQGYFQRVPALEDRCAVDVRSRAPEDLFNRFSSLALLMPAIVLLPARGRVQICQWL